MKLAWFISILLHTALLTGGMLAFSKTAEITDQGRIIPIELVSISDITNIRAAVKAKAPEDISPDVPPMTLETPLENTEAAGEAKTRTSEAALSLPSSISPPAGGSENVPAKRPEPKPVFDLDNMSALIDKTRAEQPEANQQKTLQSEQNFYEYAETAREGVGLGTDLTVSELDALQSAMYRCWRIPLDAKNPEDLVVRVKVSLRPDGYVQTAELLDQGRIARSSDPFLKVAAQRAVNAVSKCAPYDFLPADKYDRWKEMTLRFKPEL